MSEIDAMKALVDAFEPLDGPARERVLVWAHSKYSVDQTPGPTASTTQAGTASPSKRNKPTKKKAGSTNSGKKAKISLSMDKHLNLVPSEGPSAMDFQSEKSPSSLPQKCVVAAYYLREYSNASEVSATGVYTFFKSVGWKQPTDLKNTLQQAGTKGWLDTANADNILITSTGENLVEHDLPTKGK